MDLTTTDMQEIPNNINWEINTTPLSNEEIESSKAIIGNKISNKTDGKYEILSPAPPNHDFKEYYNSELGGNPDEIYLFRDELGRADFAEAKWIYKDENGGRKKHSRPLVCVSENNKIKSKAKAPVKPYRLYNLDKLYSDKNHKIIAICEGPKDAENVSKLLDGVIGTASLFGADGPKHSDFSIIKDCSVILCGDLDSAGESFNDNIYDILSSIGYKSIQVLNLAELGKYKIIDGKPQLKSEVEYQEKYDVSNAIEDGWNTESINLIPREKLFLNYFTPEERQIFDDTEDKFFIIRPTGVYVLEEKKKDGETVKEEYKICSYLEIKSFTRDNSSENWGRVLVVIDRDGRRHEIVIPMSEFAGDGTSWREKLLSIGLEITPGNKAKKLLESYIQSYKPKNKIRCLNKLGWADKNVYASGSKIYTSHTKEKYVLQRGITENKDLIKGDIYGWNQDIGSKILGNSRLIFTLSACLSAPFLYILSEENFGIHFSGPSSIGKTTALHLAKSVLGKELNSWRTTDNAAESLAEDSNDSCLLLDEISQVDAKSADNMSYMLGNGFGKARANKYGEGKDIKKFRLILISTGETGLESKLAELGKTKKAGQDVRLIEVSADTGIYGIFEELNGFKNGDELSIFFKTETQKYSGLVFDSMMNELIKFPDEARDYVMLARDYWLNNNHLSQNNKINGQIKRVARKIATISACGEFAIKLGIIHWQEGTFYNACTVIFKNWMESRGSFENKEVTDAINRLKALIQRDGSSRFEVIGNNYENQKITNRAGFKRKDDSDNYEYLLFPRDFESEICAGANKNMITKSLIEKSYLIPDAKGKSSQSVNVPGFKQARFYVVKLGEVEDNETV